MKSTRLETNLRATALGDDMLDLVRLFVAELDEDVTSMRAALTSGDVERLELLAHRLKGAAGSYGFPEITRQAAMLEESVRERARTDDVACELSSLEALCECARRRSPH